MHPPPESLSMTHEAARRPIFRLWLRAFAGIVAVVSFLLPEAASANVSFVQTNATAAFSQTDNGRTPQGVFITDAGVYELDVAGKSVRVWQRSDAGLELLLPSGETAFRPFTKNQYQYASPRPQRFTGVDPTGEGTQFNHPAGLAKHPTENKFAVVSGGIYQETRLVKNIPSVQIYAFTETPGADGALESVEFALEDEFQEAFFTTTNGMEQVLVGYTNIVTIVASNEVSVASNWVHVISLDPFFARTNDWDNAELAKNRPPPDNPVFPDERFYVPAEDDEYPILVKRTFTISAETNVQTLALYEYQYQVMTNASYLSTATDVAFLGDAGIVVPISDCGYSEVYNDRKWDMDHWVTNRFSVSGLAVFDAEDPSRPCIVFPCATNLPGRIAGIDVDQETGDIYVAVPSASAVYRFKAPGAGPGSWVSYADRTVIVPDPDFVAGVPSQPSSGFGYLSSPEDVSVWRPDDGSPILLVADNANNRIAAFDVNATWSVTNWLGTAFRARMTSDGLPEDPTLGFVLKTAGSTVLTNWYRIEAPAFPLFSVDGCSRPAGVFGQEGAPVLASANVVGADIRLYGVALDELDSDVIHSFALYWPGAREGFPDVSTRDFAIATNDAGVAIALMDAPHSNPAAVPCFLAMESDAGSNVLSFVVSPSRHPRTYTLSISPSDGAAAATSGTADVPAGATTGSFSFHARDGVEFAFTNVVLWATNLAPNGATVRFPTNEWCDTIAFAETNLYRATPLYEVEVSIDPKNDSSFSTNLALVVRNEAPTITNAIFYGWVSPGNPMMGLAPKIFVYGLGAEADDVAADSSLRYLWWATTNVNWAANNLYWAATNNAWAADASAEWEDFGFFAGQTQTAVDGLVTNLIDLKVARGIGMPLPFDYNVPNGPYLGYQGISPGASWGTTPFVVVCTVLDKDGGATVVAFPQKSGSADYNADWTWNGANLYLGMPAGISGDEVSDASYAASFVGVSDTAVTFVLELKSGTPSPMDTVTLQSSTTLDGAANPASSNWSALKQYLVGSMDLPATITNTAAGSGPIRFYRVVLP